MTGNWEFKLRQIEKGTYRAEDFLNEMKKMVSELVVQVRNESSQRITIANQAPIVEKNKTNICPKCKKGNILKGNTAYGCSNWKNGCAFRLPFTFMEKKLTAAQIQAVLKNGKTAVITGFLNNGTSVNGKLKLNKQFELVIE